MKTKELFSLSLIPFILGGLVVGILWYVSVAVTADYEIIVWDSLFTDIVPIHLALAAVFAFGSIVYVVMQGRKRYDIARNILYALGGFLIAIIFYVTWQSF